MDRLTRNFVTEMFLDSDGVTSINRLVVNIAKVINENSENISAFADLIRDEYQNQVTRTHSVKNFYEETVTNFTNEDYRKHFKMKRDTVEALIKFLEDYAGPSIVPVEKKVHIFLWLLTNSSSSNEVGLLFDLSKAKVNTIFHEIASLLTEQRYHFISWPSIVEQHQTRIKVNSRFKFPNCVGFIDACRLKVSSGRKRKLKPNTVLLQAVCDESLMFIDIHVGEVGCTRKGKVFRESPLAQELKNFIDLENHILGGFQYKLKMNLITPFSFEEVLTSEEMKFNEIHLTAHSYIGQTFEMLKERFRKLNHIDTNRCDTVKKLISAACVLHNFILLHEGCSDVKVESIDCDNGVTIDPSLVKTAIEKRQFLCNYINYLDST